MCIYNIILYAFDKKIFTTYAKMLRLRRSNYDVFMNMSMIIVYTYFFFKKVCPKV